MPIRSFECKCVDCVRQHFKQTPLTRITRVLIRFKLSPARVYYGNLFYLLYTKWRFKGVRNIIIIFLAIVMCCGMCSTVELRPHIKGVLHVHLFVMYHRVCLCQRHQNIYVCVRLLKVAKPFGVLYNWNNKYRAFLPADAFRKSYIIYS